MLKKFLQDRLPKMNDHSRDHLQQPVPQKPLPQGGFFGTLQNDANRSKEMPSHNSAPVTRSMQPAQVKLQEGAQPNTNRVPKDVAKNFAVELTDVRNQIETALGRLVSAFEECSKESELASIQAAARRAEDVKRVGGADVPMGIGSIERGSAVRRGTSIEGEPVLQNRPTGQNFNGRRPFDPAPSSLDLDGALNQAFSDERSVNEALLIAGEADSEDVSAVFSDLATAREMQRLDLRVIDGGMANQPKQEQPIDSPFVPLYDESEEQLPFATLEALPPHGNVSTQHAMSQQHMGEDFAQYEQELLFAQERERRYNQRRKQSARAEYAVDEMAALPQYYPDEIGPGRL